MNTTRINFNTRSETWNWKDSRTFPGGLQLEPVDNKLRAVEMFLNLTTAAADHILFFIFQVNKHKQTARGARTRGR